MQLRLSPSIHLEGSIALPASKSISNRALIIRALGENSHPIENLAICDDTEALEEASRLDK